MIGKLEQILHKQEIDVVSPLFRIPQEIVSSANSKIEVADNFVLCKFESIDGSKCPFEFHFIRNNDQTLMNFYLGMGAELYNCENFADEAERIEIAEDINNFLISTVRCEQHLTNKGIMRAIYSPSMFVVDGLQIRFIYKADYSWPFFKHKTEIINYDPWVRD